MLLTELTGNAEFGGKELNDIIKALSNKFGFAKKAGMNAVALIPKNKSYVYRFWIDDPGYEDWLNYALKHQSNKHVVKILSKIRTVKTNVADLPTNKTIKFVKLEKLSPLEDSTAYFAAANFIGEVIWLYEDDEIKTMGFDGFLEVVLDEADAADSGEESLGIKAQIQKEINEHKDFFKLCFDLICLGFMDIHEANVMLRGNIPVVTDPAHSDEAREISASRLSGV